MNSWDNALFRDLMVIFVGRFISILPFSLLVIISRLLAPFLALFSSKKGLGISPLDSLRFKRCLSWLDGHIWRFKRDVPVLDRVEILNIGHFEACRSSGRGTLFVSIHQDCTLLFFHWLYQFDPTVCLYVISNSHLPERPRLNGFFRQQHETLFKGKIIYSGGDLRRVIRALEENKSVVLFQDICDKNAEPIDFLGHRIRNPLGALRIAKAANCPILPFMVSNSGGVKRWAIRFLEPIDPQRDGAKKDLISSLEEMIKAHPEAWRLWDTITNPVF